MGWGCSVSSFTALIKGGRGGAPMIQKELHIYWKKRPLDWVWGCSHSEIFNMDLRCGYCPYYTYSFRYWSSAFNKGWCSSPYSIDSDCAKYRYKTAARFLPLIMFNFTKSAIQSFDCMTQHWINICKIMAWHQPWLESNAANILQALQLTTCTYSF